MNMKTKYLILVAMLVPFIGAGQTIIKRDSLKYYKFHAEAQFDMVGDYATTIYWLNKAIRLDPKDDELYLMRAFSKGRLDDWKGREADYSIVISLDPGNVAAYTGRASARVKLKKYREAISDYDWLLDVDPHYYGFYLDRGICKWELREKDDACRDYRQASRLGSVFAYVLIMEHCLE
ncbi:MAG: hypothetical protein WCK84_06605 [Bacteroidota bacterium]